MERQSHYRVRCNDLERSGCRFLERDSERTSCLGWKQVNIFYLEALSLLKNSIRNLNSFHLYSLGGFTALSAAVGSPEQIAGVALLNSAGQFADASRRSEDSEKTFLNKFILKPLREIFQRVVLSFLFWQAKQPSRIESVLKNVCHFLFGTCKRDILLWKWLDMLACSANAGVHKHLQCRWLSSGIYI